MPANKPPKINVKNQPAKKPIRLKIQSTMRKKIPVKKKKPNEAEIPLLVAVEKFKKPLGEERTRYSQNAFSNFLP
jgi:hypothetical protein